MEKQLLHNKLIVLMGIILLCTVACQQPLHTVKFDSNGGFAISDQLIADGDCVVKPANPTKGGYIFVGWYSDSALANEYDFSTPVKNDLTLYSKWSQELPVSESGPYIMFSSNSSFSVEVKNKGWDGVIQYSIDGTSWLPNLKTSPNGWDGSSITSGIDKKLYFRGTGNSIITGLNIAKVTSVDHGWSINGTGVSVTGNIMALLNYSDPDNARMGYCCFMSMFANCTAITSISPALLPATVLSERCYAYMFSGCTSLTAVPTSLLPSLSLTEACYCGMFCGCDGITSLPAGLLPSAALKKDCYSSMFSGCTSLTTVTITFLPAMVLTDSCYAHMFADCSLLTQVPHLPAKSLVFGCYEGMFKRCSSLKITDTASASAIQIFNCPPNPPGYAVSDMFEGCVLQDDCPGTPLGSFPDGTSYYFVL